MPRQCASIESNETLCKYNSIYRAQDMCVIAACPRSASDGRIKRILPKNTKDRPDYVPNDPEDY